MFFRAAAGKHLVSGLREAQESLRRSIRPHEGLDDVHQALDWPMGAATSYGIRREVVVALGLWLGMQA
jgi:hypothetical protein